MDIASIVKDYSGTWKGKNILHDPMSGTDVVSHTEATFGGVANGKFVRIDYGWTYDGQGIDGSLFLGYRMKDDAWSGTWVDGWHMGSEMMTLTGSAAAGGGAARLALEGTYQVEGYPSWGWRIELAFISKTAISIKMVNISPEKEESPAVEIELERAG